MKSRRGTLLWLWAELMLLYGDSAEPPPPPMQSLWWKFPATDTNTKYLIFVEKLNIRYVEKYRNCNHCKEERTNVLLSGLYHEFCAFNEPNLIFKQVATMNHQYNFFLKPMFILSVTTGFLNNKTKSCWFFPIVGNQVRLNKGSGARAILCSPRVITNKPFSKGSQNL